MNPELRLLQPYPFEKLHALKADILPVDLPHISLSIGEPQHPAPQFVLDVLAQNLAAISRYPLTRGSDELRESIASWLIQRFRLPTTVIDPQQHVLPVNGTREALFAFAQAVVDRNKPCTVLMPNPFYQIYEGAALLAGAELGFMNCGVETGYLPDFDAIDTETWARCQLIYICTPGNPSGAVLNIQRLQRLIELAEEHDFIIASDECYSEIYFDDNHPPPGLLEAATQLGVDDFRRCVVFHSLSKRSNLPGLRSGFVAGDAQVLSAFLKYRTYHGSAMPPPTQLASSSAWLDEVHVVENRQRYREKFAAFLATADDALEVTLPEAGFYFWAKTPINEEEFARRFYATYNVTVLPGSYLSRTAGGINPGQNYVRMALVAPLDECVDAANRLKSFVASL